MPIEHVYHMRRRDFRGHTLYPLHGLRDVHPDLYEAEKRKYTGREQALELRVPLVDLRWNDVVHCAPIHPHLILRALRETGDPGAAGPPGPLEWFRIPVARLAPHRVVWNAGTPGAPLEAECEWFDPQRHEALRAVPERTLAYYRHTHGEGRRPLLFSGMPHVLVAGPIDVSGVEVIDWRTPPEGQWRDLPAHVLVALSAEQHAWLGGRADADGLTLGATILQLIERARAAEGA